MILNYWEFEYCSLNYQGSTVYAIFNYQHFNNMLTNLIVSFEQLGSDIFFFTT